MSGKFLVAERTKQNTYHLLKLKCGSMDFLHSSCHHIFYEHCLAMANTSILKDGLKTHYSIRLTATDEIERYSRHDVA